jgi:hypothetical protein
MTPFELPGHGARPRLIAGLALLTVALAPGGIALAMAPYTVHVAVPATVKKGHEFKVTASGESANLSRLTVFPASGESANLSRLTVFPASGESANLSRLTVFLDSTACAPRLRANMRSSSQCSPTPRPRCPPK